MIWGPKKIKELESENEELKALLDGFNAKEERLKRFEELIKKARIEFATITKRKDQTAHTLEKLETERIRLNKEIQKLSYEIKQLQEMKLDEENQLFTLNKVIHDPGKLSPENETERLSERKIILNKEIDAFEKRRDEIKRKTIELEKRFDEVNHKVNETIKVERALRIEIEKKKEEIKGLLEKQKLILQKQQENLYSTSPEFKIEKDASSKLSREELGIKESLEKLSAEEAFKKEQINELEKKISSQRSQLESLVMDYKAGVELLNAVSNKQTTLNDEIKVKQDTLAQINGSIDIATARLTDLNNSLEILDEEYATLSKEVDNKKSVKNNVENELNEKLSQKKELDEYLKELKETIGILSQLKNDIEDGSGLSAKRFTGIIKYYSSYISEMYKQKLHLEKVLNTKEREVEEKDRLLEEKQSALYELERNLFIDQDTTELFRTTIEKIQNQWEQLKNIIPAQSGKGFEKILNGHENVTEKDFVNVKLMEFENTLKEISRSSGKYLKRINNKNLFYDSEKAEYSNRLNELNDQIEQAVNQLASLHNSINKIKEEHEEHRQDINKLVSIKEKLEQEISKYETTIDKYEKIMSKIKNEQKLIKEKRLSQEHKIGQSHPEEINETQNQDKIDLMKT
jgi:chromosome segregation ATPase